MTDYTDKTDAELDALAAERMGKRGGIINEVFRYVDDVTGAGDKFSPTTDANDRDEWVEWVMSQGLWCSMESLLDDGIWDVQFSKDDMSDPLPVGTDKSLGRAAVIAGLRATDE